MATALTLTRRTNRPKKPSLKALEALRSLKIQNSGLVQPVLSSDEDCEEQIYEFSSDEREIQKPTMLHDGEAVPGEDIFTFQKRKTKDGLSQKIAEAQLLKTPHAARRRAKKTIEKLIMEDSESEFEVSSDQSESAESESEDSSDTASSEEDKSKGKRMSIKVSTLQGVQPKNRKYKIKTDEYFENAASKKVVTSNNTLEKLETPRLPQYQLQKLLSKLEISEEHKDAVLKLNKVNESCFERWLFFLNENFNVLLYGLGSKRHILNKFQKTFLNQVPVIVVNGYFPSLSIKHVLDTFFELLDLGESSGNPIEACEVVAEEMAKIPQDHVYIIIHNIEGQMLRTGMTQNIVAKLASIKNVHLIASIDHINAPLIWDHKKLGKFNFTWWDATSYSPYSEETSFEESMMVQQSSTLALSSLRNVFASLTSNSKSIYNLIVKHQLENGKSHYYQGFAFKDLYLNCRESFIVSSDLALRAQLTEFVDHKMLRMKRSADGTEFLLIPLANPLLQKFLDENQ